MAINLEILKEPRGLIRIIQFIFTFVTYQILTSYEGVLDIFCNGIHLKNISISYPFHSAFVLNDTNVIHYDYSNAANITALIAALSLLISLFLSVFYIFTNEMFMSNQNVQKIDCSITIIVSLIWLITSLIWIESVADMKSFFANNTIANIEHCSIKFTKTASLNILSVLNILNLILWSSSIWFVLKETEWFIQLSTQVTTTNQV